MSIAEANLNALQQRFPAIAERLSRNEQDAEVGLRQTQTSCPTVTALCKGQWMALHHPGQPVEHAREFVQSINDLEPKRNVILYGLGLGYAALLIRERLREPHRLFLFEPSISVFRAAVQTVDLSALLTDPCVRLVVGGEPGQCRAALMEHLLDLMANSVTGIEYPPCSGAFPEWIEAAKRETQDVLRFGQSGLLTKFKDGPLTLSNLIGNLDALAASPGLAALGEAMRGIPAIIVAAGPSLKKNMRELKRCADRTLIIAVDTALEPLLNEGITPHWVITVDPTELNLRHFKQDRYESVRLLFDPEARPEIPLKFERKLTAMTDKHEFFSWLNRKLGEKGVIKKGSMVSQSALYAAASLGCDPIILIGQDLALDPGSGLTHLPGSANCREVSYVREDRNAVDVPDMKGNTISREPLFWVEGVLGEPVPTVQSFLIYIRMLEDDARRINSRIIDATEGGARLKGTEIMTLTEAIDRFAKDETDVDAILKTLEAPAALPDVDPSALKRELLERLNRCKNDAQNIRHRAEQLTDGSLAACQSLLKNAERSLFGDPVDEYLIEYAAPRTAFEHLKTGPGGQSDTEKHSQCLRRIAALADAADQAVEFLAPLLNADSC